MDARFLIISPMRNEAAHVERRRPRARRPERPAGRWVVVDDGSTDDTAERLQALADGCRSCAYARETQPAPVVDRLKVAAAPRAFNSGLARAEIQDFTHVIKLDGDIELPPDYFERILRSSRATPSSGSRAAT